MVFEFSLYFGATLFQSLVTNTDQRNEPGYRRFELSVYLPRLVFNKRSESPWEESTGFESEFTADTSISTYSDSAYGVLSFAVKILGFGIGFNYQNGTY